MKEDLGNKMTLLISRWGNLVPTFPHIALVETLVHALRINAENTSSEGIFFEKLTLNLG